MHRGCKTGGAATLRFLPPTCETVLQQIRLRGFFSWVVKRATSLFNLFWSNVAKQVARFLLPVLPYLYIFEVCQPSMRPISWAKITAVFKMAPARRMDETTLAVFSCILLCYILFAVAPITQYTLRLSLTLVFLQARPTRRPDDKKTSQSSEPHRGSAKPRSELTRLAGLLCNLKACF